MTVIHFKKNDKSLCETKAKTIKLTFKLHEVTCKRCLNKLETPTEKFTKKNKIKYNIDRKFGPCLEVRDNILTLGDLNGKVNMMKIVNGIGQTSTSMKFSNVLQFFTTKEKKFLKNWFQTKKKENGGYVNVLDVQEEFKK